MELLINQIVAGIQANPVGALILGVIGIIGIFFAAEGLKS